MTRPTVRSGMRRALAATATIALALVVASCAPSPAPSPAPVDTSPCAGTDGVGGTVPAGLGPGDLVSAVDLTPTNSSSPGFPTDATVWRMLYVTTGVDETDLQLVCGMVAAPKSGPAQFDSGGRILSWSHGTVGLDEGCLPSSEPQTLFWSKMPGGINAIAWGSDLGKHEGSPADGLLQYALDEGMIVAAADYQPDTTYVVGKMEASAVLDASRAATQLMSTTFASEAPTSYDTVIWGHSQGGHAALWAGQLAETYLAASSPSKPTARITLVGVAALAPASNFVTQAQQPGVQPGDGLADWEMHKNIGLDLPIDKLQMQIGPALFSYIFGAWGTLSTGPPPAADARFPAYPAALSTLDLSSIVTSSPGAQTVSDVKALCLTGAQAKVIKSAVEKYEDAATNRMLVPELWNLPDPYTVGEFFKGGLDTSCATTTEANLAAWCEWMRWNLPGPLGSNPYPKAPIVDSQPVPLLIAQGLNDDIIHCQPPEGASDDTVPDAANCMSRALYDSLASAVYCPADEPAGYLQLVGVQQVGVDGIVSPATHFSIPGEISARAITEDARDLAFEGSPLQKFMTGAFEGALDPGCAVSELR